MIRPRFALLASLIALCLSFAGNGPSAQAQIIFPIPSNTQSDLLLAKLAPAVHTCALPPNYYAKLYGESLDGSIELIQAATAQLGQQVTQTAAKAWRGISDQLSERSWSDDAVAQSATSVRLRQISAVSATSVRPSSPDYCPLAGLLDPIDPQAALSESPLSSTADQLPELCGADNVFFEQPDFAAVAPVPFTLDSISRAPRASSPKLNSGVTSGGKNVSLRAASIELANMEPVCSWMASRSLTDAGYWLTQQVASSQSWLGDTINSIVRMDLPLIAPPQSDPGAPAIREQVATRGSQKATIIVTPFGPVATTLPLRSNPLRSSTTIERMDIKSKPNWDKTISLLSSLNPLRPWHTWAKISANQLVDDALNGGREWAEIVQDGAVGESSLPPLPEISKPSIINASAVRAELEESDNNLDECWVDESMLPLDPAWFDIPCPCDRAVEEYERKSRTAKAVSQDSTGQDLDLGVNMQYDGRTRPAQAQSIVPTRALSHRNPRFGLAAGFAPGRPAPRQQTLLNLQQLEMVNAAAQRIGLASGRVAQGFQEAADILMNSLDATPRTAGNTSAEASR